jgi:hypothetical protein
VIFSDRYHGHETNDLHRKCHFLKVHILEYHSTKFREIPITFATGSNPLPSKRGAISNYNTRNSEDYTIPKCRLEVFNKTFIPDTVRKWNSLSSELTGSTSIKDFKKTH